MNFSCDTHLLEETSNGCLPNINRGLYLLDTNLQRMYTNDSGEQFFSVDCVVQAQSSHLQPTTTRPLCYRSLSSCRYVAVPCHIHTHTPTNSCATKRPCDFPPPGLTAEHSSDNTNGTDALY